MKAGGDDEDGGIRLAFAFEDGVISTPARSESELELQEWESESAAETNRMREPKGSNRCGRWADLTAKLRALEPVAIWTTSEVA